MPLRKGRKRYIATSFVITLLSILTASLDMAGYFQILFQSTSPRHFVQVFDASLLDWKTQVSQTALGVVIGLGDALLVRLRHGILSCVSCPWLIVFSDRCTAAI